MTIKDLAAEGTNLNGAGELGLLTAMQNAEKVGDLFIEAHKTDPNAISAGQAIKMRNKGHALAGRIAELYTDYLAFHELGTKLVMDATGEKPTRSYAELDTVKGGGR